MVAPVTRADVFRLLFSFKGTTGRVAYVCGGLATFALMYAIGSSIMGLINMSDALRMVSSDEAVRLGVRLFGGVGAIGLCVIFFWNTFALLTKRHRSMGLPGWSGPVVFVGALALGWLVQQADGSALITRCIGALFLGWQVALVLWPARDVRRAIAEVF